MQLLWHKNEIVYVPVADGYRMPYNERWIDKGYLNEVVSLSSNNVYISEVLHALSELRNLADNAKTPEELKGYSAGIEQLKRLLIISEKAKGNLKQLKESEKLSKDTNGFSTR